MNKFRRWAVPIAIGAAIATLAFGRPGVAAAQEPSAPPAVSDQLTTATYGDWRDSVVPTYQQKGYVTINVTLFRWGWYHCAHIAGDTHYCLNEKDGMIYRAPNLKDAATWQAAALSKIVEWVTLLWEAFMLLLPYFAVFFGGVMTGIFIILVLIKLTGLDNSTQLTWGLYEGHPNFRGTTSWWYENDPTFRYGVESNGLTSMAQALGYIPAGFLP